MSASDRRREALLRRWLPAEQAGEPIVACLGLISDTHLPQRCAALPPALFEALAGVDLLLHAGDIGQLTVLRQLSAIAPTVAVHGNDDSRAAQRQLPYQHLLFVGGRRLLLSHGHAADPAVERARRLDDAWAPKLARWAKQARRADAELFVFGHLHIPLTIVVDGVQLINPGAIASPNVRTRQRRPTVALLALPASGTPIVSHIDLTTSADHYRPALDWTAGFSAAHQQTTASILAPELAVAWPALMTTLDGLDRPTAKLVRRLYLTLARRVWAGELDLITPSGLLAVLKTSPLAAAVRAKLAQVLQGAQ
jgi:hypothetical protein